MFPIVLGATPGLGNSFMLCEAGPRIEPAVSSPMPTAPKLAVTAMPLPQDDPLAWRAGS
jgi:hypothetical protein